METPAAEDQNMQDLRAYMGVEFNAFAAFCGDKLLLAAENLAIRRERRKRKNDTPWDDLAERISPVSLVYTDQEMEQIHGELDQLFDVLIDLYIEKHPEEGKMFGPRRDEGGRFGGKRNIK